jgi:glycosyltransferase involved in cell wall biosynthesis
MANLTTIILTYNEELNIKECIESVKGISERIVVIDSFSEDNTVSIAKSMGAEVYQHKFINHSKQFKYGRKISNINTKWIMRLDADERLTNKSAKEIERICKENSNTNINGIIVRFEVNFLGKKLKHGGIYPFKKLIVFKKEFGYIEDKFMDEHIILTEGNSIELKNDSIHQDFKDLTSWVDKHNKYASKEVLDYFNEKSKNDVDKLDNSAKFKNLIKNKVYYKMPMGLRAFIYFIYRYFFKFGFLDGKEGLIFAVLQAFWYRFLVDAKIYEYKINNNGNNS